MKTLSTSCVWFRVLGFFFGLLLLFFYIEGWILSVSAGVHVQDPINILSLRYNL